MTFLAGQRLTAAALNASLANVPQLLGSTLLTGIQASITFSVPISVNHLEAVYSSRKDVGGGGAFAWLRFNGDSGSNYLWHQTVNGTSTNSGGLTSHIQIGLSTGSTDTASYMASGNFTVGNIQSTVFKTAACTSESENTTGSGFMAICGGQWLSASPITSVTLLPDAGNFAAGSSFSLYGTV